MTNHAITIETKHGPARVEVTNHQGTHWQYNCFAPPAGGAGIFALMDLGDSAEKRAAAFRHLLESGPHEEEKSLTHLSRDVMAAGSVNMAQFNISRVIRDAAAVRK